MLAHKVDHILLCLSAFCGEPSAVSSLIVEEIYPGSALGNSDAEIREALAKGVSTLQHPCSTAPMGVSGDPYAVVNENGLVYGI
ncbi:TPA: hypothetical protein OT855_004843 [Serratia liquefaciens]|nr:hypothetical protein [Serratia liquefaciens]